MYYAFVRRKMSEKMRQNDIEYISMALKWMCVSKGDRRKGKKSEKEKNERK